MTVIIVSYHFYPENNPRAFHTTGLVRGLCENGFAVDLVVPKTDINAAGNFTLHQVRHKL